MSYRLRLSPSEKELFFNFIVKVWQSTTFLKYWKLSTLALIGEMCLKIDNLKNTKGCHAQDLEAASQLSLCQPRPN